MKRVYLGLVGVVCVVALGLFVSQQGFLPELGDITQSHTVFEQFVQAHSVAAPLLFVLTYVGAVALSLPIATLLTLLGGFLFGLVWGTVYVVVGATLGAGIIFILSRYFFRDFFTERVRAWRGGEDTPPLYGTFADVLVARLIPAIPFSLINIITGLTTVSFRDYIIATAMGIAPFTMVYVYAGTKLSDIHSSADILSISTLRSVTVFTLVFGLLYLSLRVYKLRVSTEKRSAPN